MVPSYRARVEEDDGRIVGNAIRTDNEHEITHSTSRDESAQLREKIIERGRGPDAVFILRINRGRKKGGQFLLPFSSLSAQENSGNSVRVVVMEGGRKPLSRGLTDSCPLLSQSCPVERPTEAKRITARSPRITKEDEAIRSSKAPLSLTLGEGGGVVSLGGVCKISRAGFAPRSQNRSLPVRLLIGPR